MLRFPTKEQIDKMAKVVRQQFFKSDEVYAKIQLYSDGKIYIHFSCVPPETIREELKKMGFRFGGSAWSGKADPEAVSALMGKEITEDEFIFRKG